MVISRTADAEDISFVTEPYRDELRGFYPEVWLEDERNIALTDGEMNFSLFEYNSPGVYTGHYFFGNARGREAVRVAKDMVQDVFTNYPVEVIRGMTPLQKLGARWLSRQLGFNSHGVVQTSAGPCELFILTKDEWRQRNG